MENDKLDKINSGPAIEYREFLQEILTKIQLARYEMLKTVSRQTLLLYWDIGKLVNKKVQNADWGQSVVEQLSKDLRTEFPGVRGFSARNIWRMKNFYEFYLNNIFLPPVVAEIQTTTEIANSTPTVAEFLPPLVAEIGWVQNCVIIENAIVENIVKFLPEMGGNFAFVGRQYRLTHDEKEYFVDLLFFNLNLNCYVVFELKAREFQPKDFGQVQMYMQLINKQIKQNHHNPTIGVIVCRDKNRLEVEYMLELAKDPMGVATFNKYRDLPTEYAKYLPSEIEIQKRLTNFID